MTVSNDPTRPGVDQFGRLKGVTVPNASVGPVNPYSSLTGTGTSPTGVPGAATSSSPGTTGAGAAPNYFGTGSGTTAPGAASAGTRSLLDVNSPSPMGPAAAIPGGGYNPDAAPGQGQNPFFTVANTKSPDIAAQIQDMLGKFNSLKSMDPTGTITSAMQAQDPNYAKYLQQDTGAVDQYYNGDVQKALDNLRALRSSAYANATQRALGQLSSARAAAQMSQGGAGTVGDGSYLQKQALDTNANLMAQQGLDDATQARSDYGTVLQGQQQNLGVRSNLTTADIQRQLLPSQVGANWYNTLLQSLGPVAALQLQNTFYGLGGGRNGVSMPYTGGPVGGGSAPNSRPIPMPGGGQPNQGQPNQSANPSYSPVPQWLLDRWGQGGGGNTQPGTVPPAMFPSVGPDVFYPTSLPSQYQSDSNWYDTPSPMYNPNVDPSLYT